VICATKIGIRPHLLRHACASHMLKNGCDIRHIQELLGHEELTTTQLYTHINKQDLKALLDQLHPRSYHLAPGKTASHAL
jgi:site-specific recombinase XerD